MNNYQGWPLYDFLPDGYRIDKSCGSPLHGYEFAINGSPLKGGKRILVRVQSPQKRLLSDAPTYQLNKKDDHAKSEPVVIDAVYVKTVNELARSKFKQRLLNDILCDLMICEIEGWCKVEYINEIRKLIAGIGAQSIIDIDKQRIEGLS